MSLRAVHIVFIVASIGMSAVVGWWGVQQYRAGGDTTGLALAAFFLVLGVGLIAYGRYFAKKSKELDRSSTTELDRR